MRLPTPLLALLLLGACRPRVETDPEARNPIVVYFTMDTLGLAAAKDTGGCEALNALLAPYDLTAACPEGAVSPSSWTGEAHTRMLWPQHTAGDLRALMSPACGQRSVLETIARAGEGQYIFGADNSVMGTGWGEPCSPGRQPWHQGADRAFFTDDDGIEQTRVPEEDRPVHRAIDVLLERAERGEAVTVFLNAMEVGGHFPRCWFDPFTPSCEVLWNVAVEAGLTDPDQDRVAKWLDKRFQNRVLEAASTDRGGEGVVRGAFWGTMREKILYHRGEMFDDRLRRLLDGLQATGRLSDLTLVAVGDHGENPCVPRLFSAGLACSHGGVPTPWTANVPVYVVPAAAGEAWAARGFVGDGARPWSAVNLSYALLDTLGIATPADWPLMEGPGSATSWACRSPEREDLANTSAGLRVVGDRALACESGQCAASTWGLPVGENFEAQGIFPVPEDLSAWASGWENFEAACR